MTGKLPTGSGVTCGPYRPLIPRRDLFPECFRPFVAS